MTLYVDVDIAKGTHHAAMTNQRCEILIEPFPFENSKSGFDLFLNSILPSKQGSENMIIGFESTAHYADNFIHFLVSNNLIFKSHQPLRYEFFAQRKHS